MFDFFLNVLFLFFNFFQGPKVPMCEMGGDKTRKGESASYETRLEKRRKRKIRRGKKGPQKGEEREE